MAHHIVLISLDALRPDRLGCNGNPRPVSRNLDALRGEAAWFQGATSPATWTLPGHMSMLCGLEPPVHGCVSARHRYPPEALPYPLAFELLADAGYHPAAVVGGGYMEPSAGFGRGVDADDYHVIFPIRDALARVREHLLAHERTFTFFHTYAVHDYPHVVSRPSARMYVDQRDPDYAGCFPTDQDFHGLLTAMGASPEAPEATARDIAYLNDLYDSAITGADATLGRFFEDLRARGQWEETTLVITADHGESLGDVHDGRQYWSHAGPPYQEQARVPLIVKPARAVADLIEPGAQLEEPVSLVDIVPTLLDLAGVGYGRDQFDGLSLVDLVQGQVAAFETRRLVFHSCEDRNDRYLDPRLYGTGVMWRSDTKLLVDHRTAALRELYRLADDPHERTNRIDEVGRDELEQMDEAFAAYWAGVERRAHSPQAHRIDDPVVLDRLAALGYIER